MPPKRNRSGEYARRKAKCLQFNLCFRCLQPKGQNKWKCNQCLEKDNAQDRKRRIDRATVGLCDCGRSALSEMRVCAICREEDRLCQENRRKKHRLIGKCLTCGDDPQQGKATCTNCHQRATLATIRRYRANIKAQRCAFCGGELNHSTFRCNNCHEQHIVRGRIYWSKKRLQVIEHYGGGCQCCGAIIQEFLDVDHINGDGAKHRRSVNMHFYDWIIRNNFPSDLQLLCANCNRGKEKFGICPHIRSPSTEISKKRIRRRRRRQRTIAHYGGKCQCCGEANWAFLEFDHVNSNGRAHRRQLKEEKKSLISWIIENNYPSSIQLLCSNCNKAKGLYGNCPHSVSQPLA
jgi:hypothetical protein